MNAQGYNQENIQNMNRTLLLKLLRQEGVCSRVHLSNLSQLKQATVTNIISDFINWGLVKEVGFLIGNKGRRSIGISINNDDVGILAIRLARKNYSVGIFNLSGNLVEEKRVKLDVALTPRIIINSILDDAKELIEKAASRKVIAIGLALPGPFNRQKNRIELMTGILGWDEIPLREILEQTFHIPVFLEQDANAGALAQYWHSNGAYRNSLLVYVAVGQGVGAGIINDGKLLRGDIGIAGEIGHTSICYNGPRCTCGNYGCLENYCSSIAFTKEVNRVLGTEYTFEQIADMLKDGHEEVKKLFLDVCDKIAVGIVNIINNFNPSVIVIGDEMAHIFPEIMLERVKENVKDRILPEIYENTDIIISVVKKDSMMHGAAIVAIEDVFTYPLKYFDEK